MGRNNNSIKMPTGKLSIFKFNTAKAESEGFKNIEKLC